MPIPLFPLQIQDCLTSMSTPYSSVLLMTQIVALNSSILESDNELMRIVGTEAQGCDGAGMLEEFSIGRITLS